MNLEEAIEVLRKGGTSAATQEEALLAVGNEITNAHSIDFDVVLSTLSCELLNSTSPAFSYQLLMAILMSGDPRIETDICMRGLFLDPNLGSTSVRDGIFKCTVALGACTKITSDYSINAK